MDIHANRTSHVKYYYKIESTAGYYVGGKLRQTIKSDEK